MDNEKQQDEYPNLAPYQTPTQFEYDEIMKRIVEIQTITAWNTVFIWFFFFFEMAFIWRYLERLNN